MGNVRYTKSKLSETTWAILRDGVQVATCEKIKRLEYYKGANSRSRVLTASRWVLEYRVDGIAKPFSKLADAVEAYKAKEMN